MIPLHYAPGTHVIMPGHRTATLREAIPALFENGFGKMLPEDGNGDGENGEGEVEDVEMHDN